MTDNILYRKYFWYLDIKENKYYNSKHKNEKVLQGQEFYCKITKGFVRLLKFDQRHEILLNSKELFLVLNVDHYVLKCVLNYFEMEPGIK